MKKSSVNSTIPVSGADVNDKTPEFCGNLMLNEQCMGDNQNPLTSGQRDMSSIAENINNSMQLIITSNRDEINNNINKIQYTAPKRKFTMN